MIKFIIDHEFIAGLASLWIYCAAVDAMPEPVATSGQFYEWSYTFLHKIAGNLSVKFASYLPAEPPPPAPKP